MDSIFSSKADFSPLVISGPCSAESREQLISTATQLASSGKVDILRAGIWKPRTRPDSFEGVGEIGLPWLKEAKETTGLPITIEIANAKHVELALKNDIDILWIGARTTVNPFTVQEIADALEGVNVPVMVKNPINPDLQLWIGAIERIRKAGVEEVAAIHRGFSYYGESQYRNKPMWEIPIALKSWFPDIHLICDPSHISGRRDLITKVAQRAMDLGMSGLMIESHIKPDEAWSDAKQQLTPDGLIDVLASLKPRHEEISDPEFINKLSDLRGDIDELDEEIIHLIAKRMEVANKIGRYKKEHGITVLQLERWKEILRTRIEQGKKLELSSNFIERCMEEIHKESINKQTRIMNNGKSKEDNGVMW